METIQKIKNTYAIEQGFADWDDLWHAHIFKLSDFENHMDEICIRAQKEALEKVAGNFNLISEYLLYNYTHFNKSLANQFSYSLYLQLILNPENLIR